MHRICIEVFGQELAQIWEKIARTSKVHRVLRVCSLLSVASLLIILGRCTIHFKRETKSCLKLADYRHGDKVKKLTNTYSRTQNIKRHTYTHARARIQQGNSLLISCSWLFPLQGWFLPQERAAHECKGFGKSFVFVESVNHPLLSHTFVNQASLWQPAARQLESSFHGTDGHCESM